MTARPGAFAFHMPEMPQMPNLPEVVEIPDMPSMDWNGTVLYAGRPRLGIDAEDLSGQLGTFFGAPEGEGVLVREVNSDSPAEKAGLKAGDVITSLNGARIRSVGDLRQKLAAQHDGKDQDAKNPARTVKLGVLRNKSEISVSVALPAPSGKAQRVITHRTNI
jgi:S1-C subfamily serine protease